MTLTMEIRSAVMMLNVAYATLLDRGRFDELSMLYCPEGVLCRADGSVINGRLAILAAQSARPAHLETVHHVSLPFIETISAGRLSGRATFVAVVKDRHSTHQPPWSIGTFEDIYEQQEGEWLIAQRRVIVLDRLTPEMKETN